MKPINYQCALLFIIKNGQNKYAYIGEISFTDPTELTVL